MRHALAIAAILLLLAGCQDIADLTAKGFERRNDEASKPATTAPPAASTPGQAAPAPSDPALAAVIADAERAHAAADAAAREAAAMNDRLVQFQVPPDAAGQAAVQANCRFATPPCLPMRRSTPGVPMPVARWIGRLTKAATKPPVWMWP